MLLNQIQYHRKKEKMKERMLLSSLRIRDMSESLAEAKDAFVGISHEFIEGDDSIYFYHIVHLCNYANIFVLKDNVNCFISDPVI